MSAFRSKKSRFDSMRRCKPEPGGQRTGLSLLEVVLALVILAMSLVAIGQLMTIGALQSVTVIEQSRGKMYAQSLIDSVAVGILPMQATGWTPIESDQEWEYSLEVEDNTIQGLKAVTAMVRPVGLQNVPPATVNNNDDRSPSTVALRRWVLDPTFVEDQVLNAALADQAVIEEMIASEAAIASADGAGAPAEEGER